jgi:hypothetical protein
VSTLHDAQIRYASAASQSQGEYFSDGLLASVLAPLALLLLSLQLLMHPHGGVWAVGLIVSEILCLALLSYIALTRGAPTRNWITNRLRAELLRREQYLSVAGIGPYLSTRDVEAECLKRRGQIEAADGGALSGLIAMQDPDGRTWMEVAYSTKIEPHPDVVRRIETYLHYRIRRQQKWFSDEVDTCECTDKRWARLLAIMLLGAITAAVFHALELQDGAGSSAVTRPLDTWSVVTGALAIALPPVGTAVMSLRGMYDYRRRGRLYSHQGRVLALHLGALESLLQKAHCTSGAGSAATAELDSSFRAIALRTEHSLSLEMQQWLFLMERTEHEIAP